MAFVTPPVAMLSVPVPVIGPPVRPAPLATLVTVPVPAEAQAHAVPFHCSTCFVVQVFSRPRLSVPLVPPPVRPEPVAVVTPVMVLGKVCAPLNVITPVLEMCSPVSTGLVAPEPKRRFRVPEVVRGSHEIQSLRVGTFGCRCHADGGQAECAADCACAFHIQRGGGSGGVDADLGGSEIGR